MCNKTDIKDANTPKTRRYTTLQNTNCQKLHQPKQSNGKLSAHELKKYNRGRWAGTKRARPATSSSFRAPSAAGWCHTDHFYIMILVWSVLKDARERTDPSNCYPRHRCSKLLLIGVAFIWFSDRMLFTLTTPKNLENGIWCNKE